MNFRTESFDFPQNEQRRCLSWDIGRCVQMTPPRPTHCPAPGQCPAPRGAQWNKEPVARVVKQEKWPKLTTHPREGFHEGVFVDYRRLGAAVLCLRLDDLLADDLAATADHRIDDPVVLRLFGRHEPVAVGVLLDAVDRLAGMLRHQLVELRAEVEDLAR